MVFVRSGRFQIFLFFVFFLQRQQWANTVAIVGRVLCRSDRSCRWLLMRVLWAVTGAQAKAIYGMEVYKYSTPSPEPTYYC